MATAQHVWIKLVQNWNVAQQFPLPWIAASLLTTLVMRVVYAHRLLVLQRRIETFQGTGVGRGAALTVSHRNRQFSSVRDERGMPESGTRT
jgi:hypothetical protein